MRVDVLLTADAMGKMMYAHFKDDVRTFPARTCLRKLHLLGDFFFLSSIF